MSTNEKELREIYREKMAEIGQLAMVLGVLVNSEPDDAPPAVDALVIVGLSTLAGMVHEVGYLPVSILRETEEGRKLVDTAKSTMEENKGDPKKAYKAILDMLSPPGFDGTDEDDIPTVTDQDLEKLLASMSHGDAEGETPTDK